MSLKIPTDKSVQIQESFLPYSRQKVLCCSSQTGTVIFLSSGMPFPHGMPAMRIGKKNTVLTWERMVALTSSLLIPTFSIMENLSLSSYPSDISFVEDDQYGDH